MADAINRGPIGTTLAWIGTIAQAQPNRPALFEGEKVWSYRELWQQSADFARGLLKQGVRPGETVALIGTNEARYITAYLAIMRAGAVAVPMNYMLDPPSIRQQLDLVNATAVFVGDVDEAIRKEIFECYRAWGLATFDGSSTGTLPMVKPSTIGSILLTSGSTGQPKGVVHDHSAILHSALQLSGNLPFAADDRGVAFLPFHASIPEQVMPTLCAGGSLDVLPRFDVERVADACERATTLDAVPTVMARLLDGSNLDKLRNLRWVQFASEPMPVPLLKRWWHELPHTETHEFYGMTELLPLTVASHRDLDEDPTIVGRPFPTSALRIDTDDTASGSGASGEIVCHSPARMLEYLDDSDSTNAVLTADGSMRTGDLGSLDDRGFLHITGRIKDVIISGGLNVAPAEVEEAACRHPQVVAASVVGIPDSRWGETPVVVAIPDTDSMLTAAEVLEFCRTELKTFKRPSAAAVVASLPVTGIGKAAKSTIKQLVMDGEIELVYAR